jgi:hypothetical protein
MKSLVISLIEPTDLRGCLFTALLIGHARPLKLETELAGFNSHILKTKTKETRKVSVLP